MTAVKLGSRAGVVAALAWVIALLLAGCGGDDDAAPAQMAGGAGGAGVQPSALSCVANAPRMCPCIGQAASMGMQLCNATGNGYGPCTGCPAPPAATAAGQGGAAGQSTTAGAGTGGARPGMAGGGGSLPTMTDAGTSKPDGGSDGGGNEPTPSIGAVKGISCGVGLPTLCEIGKQKCCVRSLETDTCIEASAACECDKMGCTVMEAECDGPEDCASGQVCCGTLAQSGAGYDQFVCAAQCQATGQQRVACHEGETMCPTGLTCANSQLLTNVQVCIDPATIEQ